MNTSSLTWCAESTGGGLKNRNRRSKFGAVRTTVDNVTFASKAEARRYQELRLLERAGAISGLEVQPVFPLDILRPSNGEMIACGVCRSDFRYVDEHGRVVVEDVKGAQSTAIHRLKSRLVKALYDVSIVEVR